MQLFECFITSTVVILHYWFIRIEDGPLLTTHKILSVFSTWLKWNDLDSVLLKVGPASFEWILSLAKIYRIFFVLNAAENTVISPNFLVLKFCGKAQFAHRFDRNRADTTFLQNFHTRKLGEITVFFVLKIMEMIFTCFFWFFIQLCDSVIASINFGFHFLDYCGVFCYLLS